MASSNTTTADRRRFLKVTAGTGIAAGSSMLAGCTGGDGGDETTTDEGADTTTSEDEETTTEDTDEIQTGGELRVAMQSDVSETLHPHFIPDTTATTIAENFANALVQMTPDAQVEPDLAAELPEVSDDGLTYTFTIREGVQFHPPYDRELTADDIVENWRNILDSEYGAYGRSTFAGILVDDSTSPEDAVEKTGEYEVTFHLLKPFAPFLVKQAKLSAFGWFNIVPMEAVEEHGEQFGTLGTGVWGTGPFMYNVEESTQGSSYVFDANPDYFKSTDAGQLPYVDRLVYEIAPEASTRTTGLKTGDIDVNESVAATDIESLQNADGVQVRSKASSSKMSQWVNRRNFEPLSNTDVRKALLYAANREAIVQTKFKGFGSIAHSPIPPWHWAYDKDACVTYDHDPQQAQQLLSEAGYGDGFEFKCEPTNQPKMTDVAKILQQNYADVGLDMSIEPVSKSQTWNALPGGWDDESIPPSDWHSMIEDFTWGFSADDYTFATFHSGQPFNYSYYSNEEADQAMEEARTATSREARKDAYATVQKHITDDQPQPFMVWTNVSHGFRDRVHNLPVFPTAYMLFEDVWVEGE